jgi:hypothetical protein
MNAKSHLFDFSNFVSEKGGDIKEKAEQNMLRKM